MADEPRSGRWRRLLWRRGRSVEEEAAHAERIEDQEGDAEPGG